MKKILFLMAAAIVAVVLNSCTDDGNENSLVINNGNSEVTLKADLSTFIPQHNIKNLFQEK